MDWFTEEVYIIQYDKKYDFDRIEIGEDCDGLDLIEIRFVSDNKIKDRITFNPEQIDYLKQSLDKVKKAILKRKKDESKTKTTVDGQYQ